MNDTNFRSRIIRIFVIPVLIIFTIGVPLMFHTYAVTQARYYVDENRQALERFRTYYRTSNRARVDSIIQIIKVHPDEMLTITDPDMHILAGDSVPGFDYDICHYTGVMSTVLVNGKLITVLHTTDEDGYAHWDMLPHLRAFAVVYRSMLVFLLAALFSITVSLLIYRYSLAPRINRFISADERMKAELHIANGVQQAMVLKGNEPTIDAVLVPAREVGGDLYDYMRVGERLYFCVGDVSDKGVPAAMMMAIIRSLFHQTAELSIPLREIVRQINHTISSNNSKNLFCTLFAGCVNMNTLRMEYINCGHCAPLLVSQSGGLSVLDCVPNMVLGIVDHYDFRVQETDVQRGDTLLLYTDGVSEAMNATNEQFGTERLMTVVRQVQPGQSFTEHIMNALTAFRGETEQNDDITMMTVRIPDSECVRYSSVKGRTVGIVNDVLRSACREDDLRLRLAVEEVVSNISAYAYADDGELAVTVHCSLPDALGESTVTIEFADKGVAFNPLLQDTPDLAASLEDRPIGGLGIFLARQIAELTYRRECDENHLTLTYKA